ncbi:hypothetical protein KKF61_01955 [Patescibacteria group bacterium]|nr:hypothetical protein [Patescibacteria group bacterium]
MIWGVFWTWFLVIGAIFTIIALGVSNANWLFGWIGALVIGLAAGAYANS